MTTEQSSIPFMDSLLRGHVSLRQGLSSEVQSQIDFLRSQSGSEEGDAAVYLASQLPTRENCSLIRSLLPEIKSSHVWHVAFGTLAYSQCRERAAEAIWGFREEQTELATGGWFENWGLEDNAGSPGVAVASSFKEFIEVYATQGLPALFLFDRSWPAFSRWQKDAFVERYGSDVVRWRGDGESLTIREYVATFDAGVGDNRYIMGPWVNSQLDVSGDFSIPDEFLSSRWLAAEEGIHFFLGPRGSGLDLHSHPSSINYLVYGVKQWYIWPPHYNWLRSYPKFRNIRQVVGEVIPNVEPKPIVAIQKSGEAMFIPSGWVHAVINLTPTIGVVSHMYRNAYCEESIGLQAVPPEFERLSPYFRN